MSIEYLLPSKVISRYFTLEKPFKGITSMYTCTYVKLTVLWCGRL